MAPPMANGDAAPLQTSAEAASHPDAPGVLASPSEVDLGAQIEGIPAPAVDWSLTNATSVPLEHLRLSGGPLADFEVDNGCSATLVPGETCHVRLSFIPNLGGDLQATVLATWDGAQAKIVIKARGLPLLTVSLAGQGRIVSDPPGIECPGRCSAPFDVELQVHLTATPVDGWRISDWSGERCDGPVSECLLAPLIDLRTSHRDVQVSFFQALNNFIFLSSEEFPPTLGGVAPYDAACNRLATAAGINTAQGDGYIAAISDSTSLFTERLRPGVRGWVRLDGKPFADSVQQMLRGGEIYHPIQYDERLDVPRGGSVLFSLTGTHADGTLGENCSDWTTSSDSAMYTLGDPLQGGPGAWVDDIDYPCSSVPGTRITCLENQRAAALAIVPRTGKRIWLSKTPFAIGSSTPDDRCQSDRPANVAQAAALVAHVGGRARDGLDLSANYVRSDGQLVGTGEQLAAASAAGLSTRIDTGIWQSGDGTYLQPDLEGLRVWTGADDMATLGTAATTCNDWTDAGGVGISGKAQATASAFWALGVPESCLASRYLYCVER